MRKITMEDPDTLTPVESDTRELQDIEIPWGRLIAYQTGIKSIDLIENTFSFGRSEHCTVMITQDHCKINQLLNISKTHFSIRRNIEDNLVYITDFSKNGTFLNKEKLGRGVRKILKNKDVIAVTFSHASLYMFTCRESEGLDSFLPQDLKMKYAHIKQLGRGACGEVRLVKDRDTLEYFAVKKILKGVSNVSQKHKINHPTKINNEITILKNLTHPCIIGISDVIQCNNEVYIVLEYMSGGELTERIVTAHGELNEDSVKFFFYQIILAVQFLHSKGVVHRDLKPENILLLDDNPETIIKITDFGLSKITNDNNMTTMCGTLRYVAPEVINSDFREYGEYGKEVDVWSLGVILYFMLSKEYPFCGNDVGLLREQITTCSYHMTNEVWLDISPEAKDLIRRMLVVRPKERICIFDILSHPWIKNDHGMKHRIQKLFQQRRYENPLDFLVQEPPEKKFKFTDQTQSSFSDSSSDITLLCTSGSFNSTIVC